MGLWQFAYYRRAAWSKFHWFYSIQCACEWRSPITDLPGSFCSLDRQSWRIVFPLHISQFEDLGRHKYKNINPIDEKCSEITKLFDNQRDVSIMTSFRTLRYWRLNCSSWLFVSLCRQYPSVRI